MNTKTLLTTASALTLALSASAFVATPAFAENCMVSTGATLPVVIDATSSLQYPGTQQDPNTGAIFIFQQQSDASGVSGGVNGTTLTCGNGSFAVEAESTAYGAHAGADGEEATAVGAYSSAFGINTTAFGARANATGQNSMALGAFSNAFGVNSIALGNGAAAQQAGSIAIGRGSTASAVNSVALGTGSFANQANTVSIGSAGNERRITNLAAGVNGTDAVNLNQMTAAIASVASGGSVDLTPLINNIANHETRITALENAGGGGAPFDPAPLNARLDGHDAAIGSLDTRVTALEGIVATPGVVTNGSGPGALKNGTNLAKGDGAVALGFGQKAQGNGAVAIGDPNNAVGNGAVAIGADNNATGNGAVALGNGSTANGDSAVALGQSANAGAAGAIAIGKGTSAGQADAVALGANAKTTRAKQVALGGTGSSVTVGDIAASTAAQQGPTDVMTVDASGTVGRDTTIRPAIAALQSTVSSHANQIAAIQTLDALQNGRLSALEAGQASLGRQIETNNQQANGGIAAAMALGGTVMPSDAKFAVSFNLSTYRSEQGFSASAVVRASRNVYFSGGIAGSSVKGSTGGRVGMTFAW